jgi:hypothetical protein
MNLKENTVCAFTLGTGDCGSEERYHEKTAPMSGAPKSTADIALCIVEQRGQQSDEPFSITLVDRHGSIMNKSMLFTSAA